MQLLAEGQGLRRLRSNHGFWGVLPLMLGLWILLPPKITSRRQAVATENACGYADIVIIKGSELPALLGTPISRLRILAVHGQALKPVPLQVDDVDEVGRYVLDRELVRGQWSDHKPRAEDRILTKNDEIVLRASDLGLARPEPEKHSAGIILELVSSLTRESRFGWLEISNAVGSPHRFEVNFDPQRYRITSSQYYVGFEDPTLPTLPSHFALAPPFHPLPNVLHKIKMDLMVTALWGGIKVRRQEPDLVRVMTGYRQGPLRVIIRDAYAVELLPELASPSADVITIGYRDGFEYPARIHIPFSPDYVLTEASGFFTVQFSSVLQGASVRFSEPDRQFTLDAHYGGQESYFEMPLFGTFRHPTQGIFSVALSYDRELIRSQGVVSLMRFTQSLEPAPPPATSRYMLDLSWNLQHLEKIQRGWYDANLRIIVGDCGSQLRAMGKGGIWTLSTDSGIIRTSAPQP